MNFFFEIILFFACFLIIGCVTTETLFEFVVEQLDAVRVQLIQKRSILESSKDVCESAVKGIPRCKEFGVCDALPQSYCVGQCKWMVNTCTVNPTKELLNRFCSPGGCIEVPMSSDQCPDKGMYRAICSKDPSGEFCFPQMFYFASQMENLNNPTPEMVVALCTPCVRRLIFDVFSANPDRLKTISGAFDLMCFKNADQYCLFDPIIRRQILKGLDFQNESAMNELCSDPCFFGMMKKVADVLKASGKTDQATVMDAVADYSCVQKEHHFCITDFMRLVSLVESGGAASCSSAAGTLNELGCCLTSGWELWKLYFSGSPVRGRVESFLSFCGVSAPKCLTAVDSPVTQSFYIQVRWAAVRKNLQIFKDTLKRDIAASLGISESNIASIGLSPDLSTSPGNALTSVSPNAGTVVQVSIQMENVQQSLRVVAELTRQASAKSLSFSETSSMFGMQVLAVDVFRPILNGAVKHAQTIMPLLTLLIGLIMVLLD